jgi:hypothetical protein
MKAPRYARRLAAIGAAAALTVVLTENTTSASFTGVTGDTGNQVTAAAAFCSSPGGQTLAASGDTTGYQSSPTTNYGANVNIGTLSATGANGRLLIRFSLPAIPPHCVLTGATLRLYASTVTAGRTINAYRVDPAAALWTEAGATWDTLPPTTGTAVGSASLAAVGWQQWSMTSLIATLYTTTNNGLLLTDSVDNASPARTQLYESRESGTVAERPELVLTWG